MEKLAKAILKHGKLVLLVFGLALLLSMILAPQVKVDYDLSSYIPDKAPSTIALRTMHKEFDSRLPNANVMVEADNIAAALDFKARLKALPYVREVLWLDDQLSTEVPLELQDKKTVESFYKDGLAFFIVTTDNSLPLPKILRELQELAGNKGAVSGQLVNLALAQSSVESEMGRILAFAVPLALIILLASTSSWFEPILFLLTILIGVALNMGTNIMFKNISFITLSVGGVLQMAVSMDYAVFLLHRFSVYRAEGDDIHTAMRRAMVKSFSAIASSALTTFFGFLALVFMRFKIGPDMGIVLAKGIIFSMISVMVLLPVLIIFTYKIIDKTSHRSLLPGFKKLGRGVVHIRWGVLALVLLLTVPVFLAQRKNQFMYGTGAYPERSREYRDDAAIREKFGEQLQMVLMLPKADFAKELKLAGELENIPRVKAVIGYANQVGLTVPQAMVPESAQKQLLSEHYSRYYLIADVPLEAPETFALSKEIRSTVQEAYGDAALLAGINFTLNDMKDTVTADDAIVNGLAILAVGLVILFNFRSLVLPLILLFTIEFAIWVNLSIPYFTSTNLNYIGYLVISTVQLGATVDYAILLTSHYLDNRKFLPKKAAAARSVTEVAGSIIPPALILTATGLTLGLISSIGIVSELGNVLGRGASISLLMVFVLLPALLICFDKAIAKTTKNACFYQAADGGEGENHFEEAKPDETTD